MKFRTVLILFVFSLAGAQQAIAVPVTWVFEGTVTLLTGTGSFFSDQGVALGDTFSGKITYDPDTPFGTFTSPVTIPGITATTTEIRTAFQPGLITFSDIIYNTSSGAVSYDPFLVNQLDRLRLSVNEDADLQPETSGSIYDTFAPTVIDLIAGEPVTRIQVFRLVGEAEGGIFTPAGFPVTAPNLEDLIMGRYFAQEVDGSGLVQGVDTRLTSLVVPIPATWLLLIPGLVMLCGTRRS
jgi:hypothetical protein